MRHRELNGLSLYIAYVLAKYLGTQYIEQAYLYVGQYLWQVYLQLYVLVGGVREQADALSQGLLVDTHQITSHAVAKAHNRKGNIGLGYVEEAIAEIPYGTVAADAGIDRLPAVGTVFELIGSLRILCYRYRYGVDAIAIRVVHLDVLEVTEVACQEYTAGVYGG